MHPSVTHLIQVLDEESRELHDLVEALQADQQRIIKQDIAALEDSNLRKEELILRFQSLERARLEITHQLGASLGLGSDEMQISKICPRLGAESKPLHEAAEKLRALVGTLQELIAVGRGFLEQSILGIRGLLALIHSLRTPDPQTYGSTGRFENDPHPEAIAVRREV